MHFLHHSECLENPSVLLKYEHRNTGHDLELDSHFSGIGLDSDTVSPPQLITVFFLFLSRGGQRKCVKTV
jgi:hypothetical protein